MDLSLAGDDAQAVAAAALLFEHFGLEPSTTRAAAERPIRFEITRREPPVPPPTAVPIARHLDLSVRARGDLLFVDDGHSSVRVDLDAGTAELHTRSWPRGPATGRPYLIVVYTLLTLFRRRGLIPLHAAAVARQDNGVLLIAPSGSGKSTLALVLLCSGWDIVSDDSVLLRTSAPAGVTAHRLRRDLFLRSPENSFPELSNAWMSSPELDRRKRRLVVEKSFPDRVSRSCTPRCILLPQLSGGATSRVIPCPPDEALYRLLDHSTMADLEPGAARIHMEVLGQLVRQTRCFILEAARDLLDDRDRLRRLVEPLVGLAGGEPGSDPATRDLP